MIIAEVVLAKTPMSLTKLYTNNICELSTDLTEIVKIVFAIDPSVSRSLVMAIRFIWNIRQIRSFAVIQGTFKQLENIAVSWCHNVVHYSVPNSMRHFLYSDHFYISIIIFKSTSTQKLFLLCSLFFILLFILYSALYSLFFIYSAVNSMTGLFYF